jgi:DNA-binding YbaB/EbfC family protein
MKGFSGGMAGLLRQANQMQTKIKKTQEELANRHFEGTSGGGSVKIVVNGDHYIQKVVIDPEILKSSDAELLQDMIKAATNDAIKTAKDVTAQEVQKVTGGLGVPGLF